MSGTPRTSDRSARRGERAFARQYILSQGVVRIPDGWTAYRLGGFQLAADRSVPVLTVRDTDGKAVGWIVGHPVFESGLATADEVVMPSPSDSRFEAMLYRNGGAWICIVANEDPRIYLDPCASRGIVYSPELQQAASSSGLLEGASLNEDLVRRMDIPRQNNWYPFGLTARQGCFRLLPNHVLDLTTWRSRRIWPNAPIPDASIEEAAEGVVKWTSHIVRAFVPMRPYVPITAGRDSRMLLGCGRNVVEKLSTFTVATDENKLDAYVGRRIALGFQIPHRVLKRIEPNADELARWQENIDGCVAGATWRNVRTLKQLDPERPNLMGIAGEVARAFYWKKQDRETSSLTPADLLNRLRIPATVEGLEAADTWLSGVPEMDTLRLLDLLYLEQRVGCWASPQNAGHAASAFRIFPFGHRETLSLMMGLPPTAKRSGLLAQAVLEATWPALLDIPFNRPLGILARTGEQVAMNLQRAWRRLSLSYAPPN